MALLDLPLEDVRPNSEQPRKHFDEGKLTELAASIREHGLMQPITVRLVDGRYVIVAGERRYRAHLMIDARTISCIVAETNERDADEQSIVENLQRVDISPLEEAQAYQRMMERYGYDEQALAKRLGIRQAWRIRDRISLLALRTEYQQLLDARQLTPSQAFEMSRLEPREQDVLFRSISAGKVADYNTLRASADALVEKACQTSMLSDDDQPTESERTAARSFKGRIDKVAALLRSSIVDNEVVALGKINPYEAGNTADLVAAMTTDLKRIEIALRQAAIKQDALV